MIYILTSSGNLLDVKVRQQEARIGDSAVTVNLALPLKPKLSKEVFEEQQTYLTSSSISAYLALNKIDQRNRFKASVNIIGSSADALNFIQGSSSSGLGYALALFNSFWTTKLKKGEGVVVPVFATGEVSNNGDLTAIGHLDEKIQSVLRFVQENKIAQFRLCIPKDNEDSIPESLIQKIIESNGQILSASTLPEMLGQLLGKEYDGDPLNRWQPFKGLKSFEYEDSIRFYGRKKDVERLYDDLERNRGILIVSGPTGSGKSSLIKAGLIPLLSNTKENFVWTSITPTLLDCSPLESILKKLYSNLDSGNAEQLVDKTLSNLGTDQASTIDDLAKKLNEADTNHLFHIDQFEDFFTQDIEKTYLDQLKVVHELTKATDKLKIVLSIRNEYLAILLDSGLINSPVISNVSENLSVESWREIVIEQAAFSGVEFEKEPENLAERIINDASQTHNALPMVEFVLEQLFERAKQDDPNSLCLRVKDYEELGGITGAIAQRAEDAVKSSKASAKAIHHFFSLFVGVTNEGIPYPKQVVFDKTNAEKTPELNCLIESLIDSNIVADAGSKHPKIKLVHDSLFTYWERLRIWLKDQESFLDWKNAIERGFIKWNVKPSINELISDPKLLNKGIQYLKESVILDSSLSQYVQESKALKRKKRVQIISFFFVLPVLVISLLIWDKNITRSEYYNNFGERWGVPFGLGEITDDQVFKRAFNYNLVYKGGLISKYLGFGNLLIEVRHENGYGRLLPDSDNGNVARWIFEYKMNGDLDKVTYESETGRFLKQHQYQFDGDFAQISIKNEKNTFEGIKSELIGIKSNLLNKSKIALLEAHYSVDGLLNEIYYLRNGYGQRIPNENGTYGSKYSYNSFGQKISELFLNKDGEEIILKGLKEIRFEYSKKNSISKIDFLGLNDKPFLNDDGFSTLANEYDEIGNLITISHFNTLGLLTLNHQGVAKWKLKYDEYGDLIDTKNFGIDGKLTIQKDGRFAQVINTYDEVGNLQTIRFFGLDGKQVLNDYGLSGAVYKYDQRKNIIEEVFLGLDGNPAFGSSGYSMIKRQFDGKGNQTKLLLISPDGNLVIGNEGYAGFESVFDDKNNIIQTTYFDVNEKPVITNQKMAGFTAEYDKKGNLIKLNFLGVGGLPILGEEGYASISAVYDGRGNIAKKTFLDKDGQPTITLNGYAGTQDSFDDRNNSYKTTYLGIDGNPTLNNEGFATLELTFDEQERLVKSTHFGVNEELILNKEGFSTTERIYDDSSYEIKRTFLGIDGNLVFTKDGYAGWRAEYNQRGQQVKKVYFGTDGQPVIRRIGDAGWEKKFDERGNDIQWTYLGSDEKPIRLQDGYAGWKSTFDSRDNEVKRTYFDDNGKITLTNEQYAGWNSEFDLLGNEVRRTYFGLDGSITTTKDFYSGWEKEFDQRGNEIKVTYLDFQLKPSIYGAMSESGGCTTLKSNYDHFGNRIKLVCLDKDGNPKERYQKFATVTSRFDEFGRKVENSYFDVKGKPVIHVNKYHKVLYEYDKKGNLVIESYFGRDGKPTLFKEGYSSRKSIYDDKGKEVKRIYLGLDGSPTLNKYGSSGWSSTYDERGNLIKILFLGIDGEPYNDENDLYAGYIYKHGTRGKTIEKIYIDKKGNTILIPDGFAKIKYSYDDLGNRKETIYLGLDDKPVLTKDGYSMVKRTFDQRGNKVKVTFLGVDGLPTMTADGDAGWKTRYDQNGHYLKTIYFDDLGNSITKNEKESRSYIWRD